MVELVVVIERGGGAGVGGGVLRTKDGKYSISEFSSLHTFLVSSRNAPNSELLFTCVLKRVFLRNQN